MLIALLAGSAAAALLIHQTRRWLAQHPDALPVVLIAALWWLVKSLIWLWRASFRFVIREVHSW